MRPPVPDVALPRRRKASIEQQWTSDPRSAAPATFFLSRNHPPDADEELPPDESDASRASMYGVHSFEETVFEADLVESEVQPDPLSARNPPGVEPDPGAHPSSIHDDEGNNDEVSGLNRRRSTLKPLENIRLSRPDPFISSSDLNSPPSLTPLNLSNPDDPSSLPSSPKSVSNQSMRQLDEISITDDMSSQAVASGEEDDESRSMHNPDHDSTSQFIMPSIKMPSRRPFTSRGKALGRLKILVAGAPGSGKSSLIRSIVQACEDIVHVDDFPPTYSPVLSRSSLSTTQLSQAHRLSKPVTAEIYASTKPYPAWWSDLEDSRVLRRRKSVGDVVLERNICFVDTPNSSINRTGQTDAIINYIRQQLSRATTAFDSCNHDFQNLLAGHGGTQVDVILYLISEDTLLTDMECIKKLCGWTNVVPLISKADLLTPEQISMSKSSFHLHANATSVKPFLFGNACIGADDLDGQLPFAVSSAKATDDDVMDASTLMSPDYVQPLVPSELTLLVQRMFDGENIAWMRHLAAKKLTQQQREQPYPRLSHPQPSVFAFPPGVRRGSPSYTMARIADHTRQEEKFARVQLAKWASELQQSLHNERERYAAMARGERAVWLTERLGECVVDGSLIPITQTPGLCGPTEKAGGSGLLVRSQTGQNVEYRIARISPHDPLGLVWWSDDLKRRGWVIVQIVGSFGVVGGLALWLAKAWGLSSRSLLEWHFDWCDPSD
ncbi:heat shock protein [Aspergillus ellipticus CBS 707.79]|uniref:Heat shock protein n=1 Tax=Aspergillus ellipticus CBS 707.79 TaxID=1448320 RepID=A0A319DVZ7_9EURO|nr:heat shock protein [Aspergillus ellipticus CBS 707.79]